MDLPVVESVPLNSFSVVEREANVKSEQIFGLPNQVFYWFGSVTNS